MQLHMKNPAPVSHRARTKLPKVIACCNYTNMERFMVDMERFMMVASVVELELDGGV
jgi:hypothetical protein